jgi:hypothetical protein
VTNNYVTVDEFKQYITASGVPIATDTTDDAVIDLILDSASRLIDAECNRTFYPRIETHYFSVPDPNDNELMLDDDLLAITTLTNGDATAVSSSDYNLLPRNLYPKYSVSLLGSSSVYWEWDSEGNDEFVISILGMWGYHRNYTNMPAWVLATTIAEDLTAGETAVDVTSAAALHVGMIIKIDSELQIITGIATNTLTVTCGHNGSTAAAHTTGASVYYWVPQRDIWMACMEIARNSWQRRFGRDNVGAATVMPSGLVIGPRDMTETARITIQKYQRIG